MKWSLENSEICHYQKSQIRQEIPHSQISKLMYQAYEISGKDDINKQKEEYANEKFKIFNSVDILMHLNDR